LRVTDITTALILIPVAFIHYATDELLFWTLICLAGTLVVFGIAPAFHARVTQTVLKLVSVSILGIVSAFAFVSKLLETQGGGLR
jgi:uncharacterized membrane protein YesL